MDISLHIDHVDESVMRTLQQMAQEQHVSVEEIVRQQLRNLNQHRMPQPREREEAAEKNRVLSSIFGSWTPEEYEEFQRTTAPLRQIDPELWK